MKMKMPAFLIMVSLVLGGIMGIIALQGQVDDPEGILLYKYGEVSYSNLDKFESYQEIEGFLADNRELSGSGYYYGSSYYYSNLTYYRSSKNYYGPVFALDGAPETAGMDTDSDGAQDHSTTNVQVEGVDEGDIVKNDGEYAYIVSRNKTEVFIVLVYPPEDAKIVSVVHLDSPITEIYLRDDKLVVVGFTSHYYYGDDEYYRPYRYYFRTESFVNIYDVKDREAPELTRSVTLNGTYVSSRMIGDYFYLIVIQPSEQIEKETELPAPPSKIYHTDDYDYYYSYTNIMSINVEDTGEEPNNQVILMGTSSLIYVSLKNIYLSHVKIMSWVEKTERKVEEVILPILPKSEAEAIEEVRNSSLTRCEKLKEMDRIVGEHTQSLSDKEKEDFYEAWEEREPEYERIIAKENEKTMIHRVSINKGRIHYRASGGVPGHVLNRFSMDEHQGYFRIATTTGHVSRWGQNSACNHVFTLNRDLNTVGKVLNIAPGERIYSARFMGNRGYLVTFKKVDPFFVIDLSDPKNPEILGELKIPGYSNYLHPYDENHVIGLGKDAVDVGDFAWYQGVKLSLFDVTDVENPKEISNCIIGDRGTHSLALYDPHAFLFCRDKDLLVLPIRLHEVDESKYPDGVPPNAYGDFVWQGAYVFDISLEGGFELNGKISHSDDEPQEDDWWYWYSDDSIKRSFYIDDVLYTVSDSMMKANGLEDLSEINSIELT